MPMDDEKNLDLIQILMSMVQCHVKEHPSSIECRKHVVWVGCHGFGLMNTRMNERVSLHDFAEYRGYVVPV